jgi:hypothetical protein
MEHGMENQISSILRSIKLLAIANACWIAPGLIPYLSGIWEPNDILLSIINWVTSITAFILMLIAALVASNNIGSSQNRVDGKISVPDHSAPVGGIAISCLISVAIVIAMAARNEDLLLSVAIWFLYIVFAGLSINTHSTTKISRVVLYSIFPSATLLVGSMSLLAFIYILGAGDAISGAIGSSSYAFSDDEQFSKLLTAYLLMSFLSVPSISFASLARTRLIELYGKSKLITVEELEQLQSKINIVAAIIVFILGAILAT